MSIIIINAFQTTENEGSCSAINLILTRQRPLIDLTLFYSSSVTGPSTPCSQCMENGGSNTAIYIYLALASPWKMMGLTLLSTSTSTPASPWKMMGLTLLSTSTSTPGSPWKMVSLTLLSTSTQLQAVRLPYSRQSIQNGGSTLRIPN